MTIRALAIIPARGGSKRLPGKNTRLCAGTPLILWSIHAALTSRRVDRVVVSSDDQEVLRLARACDVDALLRPEALATDDATLDAVAAHAVATLRTRDGYVPDVVVLLQPTVPERRAGLIDDCIQRLFDTDADSVFTARPIFNCWWRVDRGGWAENAQWVCNNPQRLQSQEMPASELRWEQDGSVRVTRTFLIDRADPRETRPPRLIGGRVQVQPNDRVDDIDDERDFLRAEAALQTRANASKCIECTAAAGAV
jgi:CMP-N,N'-diacetyllegionaminic acid synthase